MYMDVRIFLTRGCVLQIRPRFSFKRKEVRMGEFEVGDLNIPSRCCRCIWGSMSTWWFSCSFILIFSNFLWWLQCYYLFWQVIKLDLPGTTDSYKSYWQRAIVADIKETVCRVPDTAFDGNDSFPLCTSVVKESWFYLVLQSLLVLQ